SIGIPGPGTGLWGEASLFDHQQMEDGSQFWGLGAVECGTGRADDAKATVHPHALPQRGSAPGTHRQGPGQCSGFWGKCGQCTVGASRISKSSFLVITFFGMITFIPYQ